MNKHQTLAYIKYGKLVNKINDQITSHAIKYDMIKFLSNFSGMLKHPDNIIQQYSNYPKDNGLLRRSLKTQRGIFIFYYTSLSYHDINFDGNNNFQLCTYNKSGIFRCTMVNDWISIDDVDQYINNHSNDFCRIITNI